MKSNINGILPIVAILLTLAVCAFSIWMFATGHIFWGIVFCLITIDFAADAVLSFKKA